MKRETINIILTVISLLPMTYFLLLSIYGMFNILSNFETKSIMILISMIFGVYGYIGLLMNLKQNKNLKVEIINFIMLLLGIIGFAIFNSIIGGKDAWKWIVTMEEPDEWFILVAPILISIFLTIEKGIRIFSQCKHTLNK